MSIHQATVEPDERNDAEDTVDNGVEGVDGEQLAEE